jgi:hypothetical protein
VAARRSVVRAFAPIKRYEPFAPPATERTTEPPAPAPLFPVVAINRVFDTVLLCFGPPGQWFCTSAGRNLLGYTGLALVAGSAVWAAVTCYGWPR